MDDYQAIVLASTGIVLELTLMKKKQKRRFAWVRTWLARREEKGVYNNLMQEMRLEDAESFRRFLRMNTATFDQLLAMVTPVLEKQSTRMRKPLSVAEKLACTLRYLATGESYSSLQFQFRISKSAICLFVTDVCSAIYKLWEENTWHSKKPRKMIFTNIGNFRIRQCFTTFQHSFHDLQTSLPIVRDSYIIQDTVSLSSYCQVWSDFGATSMKNRPCRILVACWKRPSTWGNNRFPRATSVFTHAIVACDCWRSPVASDCRARLLNV